MRALSILFILFLFYTNTCFAQDTIFKTDNSILISKILEINEETIRFKKSSYLEGPTYTMGKELIEKIVFSNGSEEVFRHPKNLNPGINNRIETKETKPLYIPKTYYSPERKGVYIGLHSALGLGSVFTEQESQSDSQYNYSYKETKGFSTDFGMQIIVYTNDVFGIKSGLLMQKFNQEFTVDITDYSNSYSESYKIKEEIFNVGIPLQAVLTFGNEIAFNIDFGLIFSFPSSGVATLSASNNNGQSITDKEDYSKELASLIIHEALQVNFQFKLSGNSFFKIGLYQLYGLTSYIDNTDKNAEMYGLNLSINFKLD